MYGFPLTIYLLARFFELDRGDLRANLWSTLLGLGPTGMLISMLLGYALVVIGIGISVQGWRELYRARRENRLAADDLYGLVRHPQYTGLFIALFRSEEHTSELQSLMRISYAVFCLKKKNNNSLYNVIR